VGPKREGRLPRGTWGSREACLCAALILLAACTGSSSQQFTESEGLILSGSVGDGPITGADIVVEDARGETVLTGTSDGNAGYEIQIPDGTPLPVIVRVSGGTDLVTGRAADFELVGATFDSGPVILNASPYTTLAVRTAECLGELTPENLTTAWDLIDETMNLGWDRTLIADPMAELVAEQNIATVLLANEALGEVIRRTSAALAVTAEPMSNDEVLEHLACDLAGDQLEGLGSAPDLRTTFTLTATAAAVRLEVIAGSLQVDGQDAGTRLDDALQTVLPGSAQSVANVAPVEALIEQTQDALGVLQILDQSELVGLALALDGATPSTARGQLQPALTDTRLNLLADLPETVALADDTQIADLAAREASAAWNPLISFAADDATVTSGSTTRLSWATTDAEACVADGGWSGARDLAGSVETPALNAPTEFVLSCWGRGGVAAERVFVNVTAPVEPEPDPVPQPDPPPAPEPIPAPAPAPTLSLGADRTTVNAGESVTLSWMAGNATSCTASGGWSGSRSVSGSLSVGPLTADVTFGLTCSGAGGQVSASRAITVVQPPPAPVVNLNAAPLTIDRGTSTTLSWSTSNATSCSASGGWSGSRNTSGTQAVSPTVNTTYRLTCTGGGGSGTDTVSVTVRTPAPTLTLNASPGTITEGNTTTLSWTSTNTTSCTASGGWSGTRGTSGSLTVAPVQTSTYNLSCSGAGGDVSDSVTVDVSAAPVDPPVVSLSLAASTIDAGGSTTLSWSASNANTCSATGGWSGSRGTSGSTSVSPASTTTYGITCTGDGGSNSATATLNVNAEAPTLSFNASAATVNQGANVTLSWSATNATACTASGAWSGSRAVSGSQQVGPINAASTFSLTCSGPGGNVMEMLTVSATGPVALSWVAPTQNVDGTTLNDLAGYRIYYGTESRAYSDMVDVTAPGSTSHTLYLPSGDYYMAMTALDGDGNESAYSNEVLKSRP